VRWLLRRDILGVAGRASGSDVQQLGSASWVPFYGKDYGKGSGKGCGKVL